MVVAKPKTSTLFSLGLFLIIMFSAGGFNLYLVYSTGTMEWYNILIVLVTLPIAFGVLVKTMINHKTIYLGGKKVVVSPLIGRKKTYALKDLEYWKETKIKTLAAVYKELEMKFGHQKKVTLGLQEHTDYAGAVKYLKKTVPKKNIE